MIEVRTRAKTQVPHCRRKTSGTASVPLDEFSPELAAQWHPTKNGDRKPSQFTPSSKEKVWWLCPVDPTHEWETSIGNRVRFGYGCRFCAKRSSFVTPNRSLASRFPGIAKEWHPTKNGTLTPENVAAGSSKRVWWQCLQHPEHVWDATVTTRTQRKSRGCCPFCSGRIVTERNSLSSVHPEIAAEWHPTKNLPLSPDKVTRASGRRVWWRCAVNPEHEWEANVKNRTVLKNGCPQCAVANRVLHLQETLFEAANANTTPFQTFERNLEALRALARAHAPAKPALKYAFYRMLYSSTITALETYLLDAFHQRVMSSDALIEKLLQTTPEFAERKYSVSEIIGWQRDVRNKVSEHLLGIVWHNLSKVGSMYSTMFQVSFPKDCDGVFRAVSVRHDIVHRNGRKKDGALHRISEHDIEGVFNDIESFVTTIDQQMAAV
jgi:hypothetical protein